MAFLDWLKRGGNTPKHKSYTAELHAEWRRDGEMKKLRDATGKEPECMPLEVKKEPKPVMAKRLPRRERISGHDIPF